MSLSLSDSVSSLAGVGPTRAAQLEALGIETIKDLLWYRPFRYEEIDTNATISSLVIDTTVMLKAVVISKLPVKTQKFRSMIKAALVDGTGKLEVTWFNQPYVINALKEGSELYFVGKVADFKGKPTLTNPSILRQSPLTGSLIPIYHESASISSRYIQQLLRQIFDSVEISDLGTFKPLISKYGLVDFKTACHYLHTPKTVKEPELATKRLAFEEMYTLIEQVMNHKKNYEQSKTVAKFPVSQKDIGTFASFFPYTLTPSQREAIEAIGKDLNKTYPMHRLIQGEVGSGKTTVAAFALWIAATHKKKSVLICPTNILAKQHVDSLQRVFVNDSTISIGLFTGKEKNINRDILVGTHAIFNIEKLKPAVVIIDEEHRFGVAQRETFFKLKTKPHFLSMTATPIPRTVALTALADRDVSVIVPHKSNDNIKTWVVPPEKRKRAYEWIKKTLKQTKEQGLIVCPFIEESIVETLSTVKSAKKEFELLQNIFSSFKMDLLHGKLQAKDKNRLFDKMMSEKTDILVTTPVVEVGVDIPKASIIVIEGAERFGLAQLHQLRGRVGRRGQTAYCLLFNSPSSEGRSQISTRRLLYFAKTYDGNTLAEYDLKHRGSGELLGMRQHGFDSLKFASWFDTKLIETCKKEIEQR